MPLFGTSGIRDLCPEVVSPDLARRLGLVLGQNLDGEAFGRPGLSNLPGPALRPHPSLGPASLSIGFDGRRSGPMLKSALAAGAMQAGADVHDLGLCATPTLALHSKSLNGWGVMVTASHNPPEYNGLKVFYRGHEVPDAWERRIEAQLGLLARPSANKTAWSRAGTRADSAPSAAKAHVRLALSQIPLALIRKKKPRVVVDCANAAGCALMPDLLRAAGCQVEVLNGTPGEPYGRALEPKEETLGALGRAVRKSRADLGIAHDGDADRAIVMDEKGKMLGLDAQLALVVSDLLQNAPAKKASSFLLIISTVESSLSLREQVQAHGGRLEITPVGSRYVAAAMRAKGAVFGGEPCGEYLFPGGVGVPDGLACGLYFVSLFCRKGKLSALARGLPSYPMVREKIPCPNSKKQAAMARVEKDWPFFSPLRIDGLRSDLPDGWVLVRPSGTEPYIRLTAEGKNKKELEARADLVRALIENAVRV